MTTSCLLSPYNTLCSRRGPQDVFTNEEARQLALEKFHGELGRTSSSKLAVKKVASSLAKAAIAKGSRDNVTVVVVDVRVSGQVRQGAEEGERRVGGEGRNGDGAGL